MPRGYAFFSPEGFERSFERQVQAKERAEMAERFSEDHREEMGRALEEKERFMEEHRRHDIEREMKQAQEELEISRKDWKKDQKRFERDQRNREKDQKNFERDQRNREKDQRLMEIDMERREAPERMEPRELREAPEPMDHEAEDLENALKQALLHDGLISDPNNFSLEINDKVLKVNKKEQSDALRQKYLEIIEGLNGGKIKGKANFQFNVSDKEK